MLRFGKIPLVNKLFDKKGGGEYQEFPSNNFCLTVPKNFLGEPYCDVCHKISGCQKFMENRGGGIIKIFCRKFFVSQCQKIW